MGISQATVWRIVKQLRIQVNNQDHPTPTTIVRVIQEAIERPSWSLAKIVAVISTKMVDDASIGRWIGFARKENPQQFAADWRAPQDTPLETKPNEQIESGTTQMDRGFTFLNGTKS